jgi:outer membrane protein
MKFRNWTQLLRMGSLLLAAYALAPCGSAIAAKALNFSEYVEAAIATNETIRANTAQVSLYEAKQEQSASTILPQLKVIGSVARQDVSDSPKLSANASSLKINLTQPILGIYKNRSALEYAAQQSEAVGYSGDDAILSLKLALNDAFYAALAARGDVSSYTEVRSIANDRVKETATRVKIGRSRVSDLYSAQAQLAAIDAQLEQTAVTELNARSLLSQLSGLPIDTAIMDSAKTPSQLDGVAHFLTSSETLPNIKYLLAQQQATTSQVSAARSQRLPDLDLFSNYYLHREAPLDKVRWDAGLQLTWSIYDGGLITGKVRESQSQYQALDLQLSQKRRVTETKIRQYHAQLNAILRQLPILEKSKSLAQKSYESIQKDYRLGLATILDLIQSSNTVAEAKRQLQHQIVNSKSTYIALQLNAGQKL